MNRKDTGMTYEQERKIATLIMEYHYSCYENGYQKSNPKYEKIIDYIDELIEQAKHG